MYCRRDFWCRLWGCRGRGRTIFWGALARLSRRMWNNLRRWIPGWMCGGGCSRYSLLWIGGGLIAMGGRIEIRLRKISSFWRFVEFFTRNFIFIGLERKNWDWWERFWASCWCNGIGALRWNYGEGLCPGFRQRWSLCFGSSRVSLCLGRMCRGSGRSQV